MQLKRIGLLGGTFDPIHLGHVQLAVEVKNNTNIDEVWFIPNNTPPHREKPISSSKHRLKMCEIAISEYNEFSISKIDVQRDEISYAVDTVRILKKQYPNCEFFYIIGVDAAKDLMKWREPLTLINECNFIVVNRPGYDTTQFNYEIEKSPLKEYESKFQIITLNTIDVSSTEVRSKLSAGAELNNFLNENVIEYIKKNKLYN